MGSHTARLMAASVAAVLALRIGALILLPGPPALSDEVTAAFADELEQAPWLDLRKCQTRSRVRPAGTNLLLRGTLSVVGLSLTAVTGLSIALGLALAGALTLATVRTFGSRAGLATGVLLAGLPVHVGASLATGPTVVCTLPLAASWLAATGGGAGLSQPSDPRRAAAIGLLASLALMFRYEMGLVLGVVCFGWLSWTRRRPSWAVAGLVATLAVPVYLMSCEAMIDGDPLHSLHAQLRNSAFPEPGVRRQVLPPLRQVLTTMTLGLGPLGTALAVVGMAVVAWRRFWVPIAAIAVMVGFLVYRGTTTTLEMEARYLYPCLVALTVLAGVGAGKVADCLADRLPRTAGSSEGDFSRSAMGRTSALALAAVSVILALLVLPGPGAPVEAVLYPRLSDSTYEVSEWLEEAVDGDGPLLIAGEHGDVQAVDLLLQTRLRRQEPMSLGRALQTEPMSVEQVREAGIPPGAVGVLVQEVEAPLLVESLQSDGWSSERRGGWILLSPPVSR